MGTYRITRNTECSTVDYIAAQLTASGWTGVRTELDFAYAYKGALPCIVVNADDNPDERREIGSNSLVQNFNLEIRIFADNDGQRKDLRDWLITTLMPGWAYYTIVLSNNVETKTLAGRINVIRIMQNRQEMINLENLKHEDKFRHYLKFQCRVST